jgi:ATP-dependent Clp protease adapter protein ClpS
MRASQVRPATRIARAVCFAHASTRSAPSKHVHRRTNLVLHDSSPLAEVDVVRALLTTLRDISFEEASSKTGQAHESGSVVLRTYFSPTAYEYCESLCEKGLNASVEELP